MMDQTYFPLPKSQHLLISAKLPGDPRKYDELIFGITSKVVMIEPSYWMEKKGNFIVIFMEMFIYKYSARVLKGRWVLC